MTQVKARTQLIACAIVAVLAISGISYTYFGLSGVASDVASLRDTVNSLIRVVAPETNLELLLAARKEGKVIHYTPGAVTDNAEQAALFEKTYPGITVEWVKLSTNVVAARYMSEVKAGKVLADVLSFADSSINPDLKKQGLLMRYDSPQYAFIDERYKDPDHYWAFRMLSPLAWTINPKKVKPGELRVWKDLLDPKWKGKICMEDMIVSGVTYAIYYATRTAYGREFWEQMAKQKIVLETDTPPCIERVIDPNDPVAVALINDLRWKEYYDKGASIGTIYPEDGAVMDCYSTAIVAQPPHPNAAKLYFDFLLSEPLQRLLSKLGRTPSRKGVARADWLPPVDKLAWLPMNVADSSAKHNEYLKEYKELFGLPG